MFSFWAEEGVLTWSVSGSLPEMLGEEERPKTGPSALDLGCIDMNHIRDSMDSIMQSVELASLPPSTL